MDAPLGCSQLKRSAMSWYTGYVVRKLVRGDAESNLLHLACGDLDALVPARREDERIAVLAGGG